MAPPSVAGRVDAYQRRHRWLGRPLAVGYKFVDDQGGYLTALITYYGFLSLFPLLLLMLTVLGFLLDENPELQQRIVQSALRQFPVIGDQIGENVQSLRGNTLALVTGIVLSLYGALGVAQATQAALNRIWAVPRHRRPNPILSRARSALLLLILGAGLVVTTVLSALTAGTNTLGPDLGWWLRVLVAVLGVSVNAMLFLLSFRVLTAAHVSLRDHLPGAVGAAVAWQLLQLGGTYYVDRALRGASASYGLFGIVLGLLAWIYLGALTVVVAAEFNAVRSRRLWPRSLLTPFTDEVDLTRADERAYTSYAQTERYKGFQRVEVDFDHRDHERDDERDDGQDDGQDDAPAHDRDGPDGGRGSP